MRNRLPGIGPLFMGLVLFNMLSKHPPVAALTGFETSALMLSGALLAVGVLWLIGGNRIRRG